MGGGDGENGVKAFWKWGLVRGWGGVVGDESIGCGYWNLLNRVMLTCLCLKSAHGIHALQLLFMASPLVAPIWAQVIASIQLLFHTQSCLLFFHSMEDSMEDQ